MKKNKNDIDTDLDVDIDIDESSELWSFRNKDDSSNRNNKKEVSNIDILTQKTHELDFWNDKNFKNFRSAC